MKITIETVSLRDHVTEVLEKSLDDRIIVLDSDLSKSTGTSIFATRYPHRYIECGISEASAISIATGLAIEGKIPFYVGFSLFAICSAWTQLRMACYANANIKLIGTHPGIDNGYDGASHHANEDIALARSLPNMKIMVPASLQEFEAAIDLAIKTCGPVYIRCARDEIPPIPMSEQLLWGKSEIIYDNGNDYALIFEGTATKAAIEGFEILKRKGYLGKLINIRSIKPLDIDLIRKISTEVSVLLTVENHSVIGGLGGAVAESLASLSHHAPVIYVGIADIFTESGPTAELKSAYGISGEHVADSIIDFIGEKIG
jgi:transketolase